MSEEGAPPPPQQQQQQPAEPKASAKRKRNVPPDNMVFDCVKVRRALEQQLRGVLDLPDLYLEKAVKDSAKLLLSAFLNPARTVPAGQMLAMVAMKRFRYGLLKGRVKCEPFSLNGAVWSEDATETARAKSMRELRRLVKDAAAALTAAADAAESDAEADAGEGAEGDDSGACSFSEKQVLQYAARCADTFLDKCSTMSVTDAVWKEATIELKSDVVYEEYGMLAPKKWASKMDTNAYAIGFTNGVMEFKPREPGAPADAPPVQIQFHKAGEVPAALPPVSLSVEYAWEGADDGTPRKDPMSGAEDAGQLESKRWFEEEIMNKVFFEPAVRACVDAVLGTLLIGGPGLLKAHVFFLGEGGNNGKTVFAEAVAEALGQLAGCMSNQHFMEQKLVRDPEQPCESAVANAQLRLVLVVEPRVKDKLCESQIKKWCAGDKHSMRQNHGRAFKAYLLPKVIWLCNGIPPYEGGEAMRKKLYMVSCNAVFEAGLAADIPAEGRFKAMPPERMHALIEMHRHGIMLYLIQCLRGLYANNGVIPPEPEGAAQERANDSSVVRQFQEWVKTEWVSTRRPKPDGTLGNADWDVFEDATGVMPTALVAKYNGARVAGVAAIDVDSAKKAMRELKDPRYELKKISNNAGQKQYVCEAAGKSGYWLAPRDVADFKVLIAQRKQADRGVCAAAGGSGVHTPPH